MEDKTKHIFQSGDIIVGTFYIGDEIDMVKQIQKYIQNAIDIKLHFPFPDDVPLFVIWNNVWTDFQVETNQYTVKGEGVVYEDKFQIGIDLSSKKDLTSIGGDIIEGKL